MDLQPALDLRGPLLGTEGASELEAATQTQARPPGQSGKPALGGEGEGRSHCHGALDQRDGISPPPHREVGSGSSHLTCLCR